MSQIKTLQQIKTDIEKNSPHPEKVKILAVSKKQPVEKILELVNQKQLLFGENYVQEALQKMELLPKHLEWHMIGHLQSKKVNSIIGKFAYIHSIDSLKIAELISEKSKAINYIQNVFIEVNLGDEASKGGFTATQLKTHWPKISVLENIKVHGLMALPPQTENSEMTRNFFRNLKSLLIDLQNGADTARHPLSEVSMGTSQDYTIALQEGSTIIRIGTTLFGERQ